jgi:5-(carboxyamino)imidazole ribonucleotide mutase
VRALEAEKVVYVTVAGRSNALSGFVDEHVEAQIRPPYSKAFGGADILSSLRMPRVGSVVTVEPEGVAIAAAKIFALKTKNWSNESRITSWE